MFSKRELAGLIEYIAIDMQAVFDFCTVPYVFFNVQYLKGKVKTRHLLSY